MIGVPMPHPRDAVIADLHAQMDRFFGSGGKVQEVEAGASGDKRFIGPSPHHDRLRAERDKIAPQVQAMAKSGKTAAEAAKAIGMHIKRVKLIAQENGIKFAEPA